MPLCELLPGLEIDNEKVKNSSIFDTSKKSSEFLHSITKIKSREYRSMDNVKSILFSDSVDSVNVIMLMLMGRLGFRLGKVENVDGIGMGRRLHWNVSPDIFDLYRSNSPFGKKYTFYDPCFLSLFKLKNYPSQNL